jgi:hypothetical protein
MSETFRPKTTFWIGKAGEVLLFLVAIFGMIPVVKPMYVVIIAGAVLVIALPQFLNEIREALAIQITISATGISGRDTKTIFEMRWSDVKAIQRDDNSPKQIFISTDTNSFLIPLKYFHAQKLWEQIKSYAAPSAFEENAYQTLSSFKRWQTRLLKSRVRANKFAATQGKADCRRLNSSDVGRFGYGLTRFQSPVK